MRASSFRILLGSLCLALSVSPEALAAKARPEARTEAKPETKRPVQVAIPAASADKPGTAWTAAEPDNCARARRKLWQEGEGWIVKTITVCR